MNNKFQEDEITELKKSTSELKEAIVSIASILNKHRHGKLYFGIKDDGTVVGQEVSGKTLRYISEVISNKIEPKIYPKISNVKIEDKDCILVEFEGEDVNEDILKDYVERANKAKRIPFQYTNKEEVLNKLGLLKDNKLLNAGKVLTRFYKRSYYK